MYTGNYQSNKNISDVGESLKELSEKIKRSVYLIHQDTGFMYFSTTKFDIDKYLCSDKCDLTPADFADDSATTIYGFVLDPADLPYELSHTGKLSDRAYNIYVLTDLAYGAKTKKIDMEAFDLDSMDEVVEYIEGLLTQDSINISAEDLKASVAVIIGKPMDMAACFKSSGEILLEGDVYGR